MLEFVWSKVDVPKGHERVGSMNVGLHGSTTPKKPGEGGSASGLGNPDDDTRTSSRVPTLQGTGGIGTEGRTPRKMTYVVGSQSQVPRSSSKSPPSGGGSTRSGEGGYPNTPCKGVRLSPLIDSDNKEAHRRHVEGLDSGGRAPVTSGGGGEPSSSTKM